MITLTGLILLLSILYCSVRMVFFYIDSKNFYYLFLSVSAFSFAANIAFTELEGFKTLINSQLITNWSRVVSISFLMSALAFLIWKSKPDFARFPIVFCALPLLLIVAFPFTFESSVLKEMILAMLQAGAIIVGLILYLLKGIKNSCHRYVVTGIILFSAAFIINFLPVISVVIPTWVIKLIITAAILFITYGFAKDVNGNKYNKIKNH